jgi:hypothetical protein
MRRFALALAAAAVASGCPAKPDPQRTTTPAGPELETLAARLVIPVGSAAPDGSPVTTDAGAEALAALSDRAAAGDAEAAWLRVHYLLDLFDDARFRRDDDSLRLLRRAMGVAADGDDGPPRGHEATGAALEFLLIEVDRLLGMQRLHAGGQAARTLLAFDDEPPRSRSDVLPRIVGLKAIARGGGPLAANATLRLFGYCRRALADAVETRWADRTRYLAHCLYPLYDADPAPYFADSADRRPPPPAWRDLIRDADALLASVADAPGRLVGAARHQRQELDRFAARAADALPSLPAPADLGVPSVDTADLYDWTPLLTVSQPEDLNALDNDQARADALRRAIAGDGRATVAIAIAAPLPAAELVRAARIAQRAGAGTLQLVVSTTQVLQVPPNDYWSGRLTPGTDGRGDRARRLAVLPVSLAVLHATRPAQGWSAADSALGLHLVVEPTAWRVVAPTGEVARIPSSSARAGADAAQALRETLSQIRDAFPDEDAIIVVPDPKASAGAVLAAVHAALYDSGGERLMGRLGLHHKPPQITARTLARRVQARYRAHVALAPEPLRSLAAPVRRCYQDALERAPGQSYDIRLELSGDAVTVTRGPRNPALRQCVIEAVGDAMKKEQMASATLTLRPKAP